MYTSAKELQNAGFKIWAPKEGSLSPAGQMLRFAPHDRGGANPHEDRVHTVKKQ
jgi:hypothetical protein